MMCAIQYSNLDTRMSTSMNSITTLGWTLAEWKAGYTNNTIQLEDLYALVEQFDHADPAAKATN